MPAKVRDDSLLIHRFTYSLFIGLCSVTCNMTGYSHSYHSIKLIHCGAPQRDLLSDKMVFEWWLMVFISSIAVLFIKVGDYSLKIRKSAYYLFSVFISKRGFSSLQTRRSFGEILSGNHRFLRPSIRLVTPYNSAYLITSFTFLSLVSIKPIMTTTTTNFESKQSD